MAVLLVEGRVNVVILLSTDVQLEKIELYFSHIHARYLSYQNGCFMDIPSTDHATTFTVRST